MKIILNITIWLFLIIQGCHFPDRKDDLNQFITSSDTLVINTNKVKGPGLFSLSSGSLTFRDTNEIFQESKVFPRSITDIKAAKYFIDFQNKNLGYIGIISGLKDSKEVFIVDQNNNHDFTDDTIRSFQEIDYHDNDKLIKCDHLYLNNNTIDKDSSWIVIGTTLGRTWMGRAQHLEANFSLNNNHYSIGIVDNRSGSICGYGINPEIVILSENSNIKDSLIRENLLKKGEYLNLNNSYYKFDSITNDGKYITLVKEDNFENKIGTQVGMISPEFNCVSTKGDTIYSVNLVERPIVIANSCGCGNDSLSTQAFFDIEKTFSNRIFALRLDSGIKNTLDSWQIDIEDNYNKEIYNQYRQAYCSRIAYLIGIDKKILNKFDITDWKEYLPEQIK